MNGYTCWARIGPKVTAPHNPMTTLGMPASSSRNVPITLASRFGSRSTMTSAAPTETGIAMIRAMAEVSRVPMICGSAPKVSPGWWTIPWLVMGAAKPAPKLHALPVRKFPPLNLMAGNASTIRVMRMKPSASNGMTAPARPSQRIRSPLCTLVRIAPPGRRGGGKPAPPSGMAVGAEVATESAADRCDLVLGDGLHVRRQRLEADRRQERRASARGERPLEEGLQGRGHGRAWLCLLHHRVLVVDDRVALGRRGVDQRLGSGRRGGAGEAGQRGIDGLAGRLRVLAGLVGQ